MIKTTIQTCNVVQLTLLPPQNGTDTDKVDVASHEEVMCTLCTSVQKVLKPPMEILYAKGKDIAMKLHPELSQE